MTDFPSAPMTEKDAGERIREVAVRLVTSGYMAGGYDLDSRVKNAEYDLLSFVCDEIARDRVARASALPPSGVDRREEVARLVYDAFPFFATIGTPHKPSWVVGGNSFMQADARRAADQILALLNAPQSDGWRDIETAPKNGTEVWLACADSGPLLARWIAPSEFLTDAEIEAEQISDCADEPDWFYADFVKGGRLSDWTPTHWQPLPAPPSRVSSYSRGGGDHA